MMKYKVSITASKIIDDKYTFTCYTWSDVLIRIKKYCEFMQTEAPEILTAELCVY